MSIREGVNLLVNNFFVCGPKYTVFFRPTWEGLYTLHSIMANVGYVDSAIYGNGNGEEWEQPNGNLMGMGICDQNGNGKSKEGENDLWEWVGMGTYKATFAHL